MCPPRYDQKDQLGNLSGRDLINNEIQNALQHKRNIILVSNENFSRRDFIIIDKYHLTKSGFSKLLENWENAIAIGTVQQKSTFFGFF